jgi:hypothetical protein
LDRLTPQGRKNLSVGRCGKWQKSIAGTNGKYVSSENGTSAMMCNRNEIGDWEKFTWVDLGNYQFALLGSNGKYVCSENGTTGMMCNRGTRSGWETFTWATTTKSGTVDLETASELQSLDIYPNPTTQFINIPGASETTVNQIFDLKGSKIMEVTGSKIDVSSLAKGIYLLMQDGNTRKFIKQ